MNRFAYFIVAVVFACSPVKGTPLIDAEVVGVDMMQLTPNAGSARLGLDPPLQLAAMASLSDGTSRDVSLYATWASSDDSVATASSTGLVTAVHPGTAMITATLKGVSASAPLTVRDPILAMVNRTPPTSIEFYDAFSTGSGVTPLRSISGSATLMGAPFGIAVDVDSNELFEAEESSNGVLVYPLDGSGNVAPLRQIVGSATELTIDQFAIQVYKHEIYVSTSSGSSAFPTAIVVFPEDGSGNIAPTRVLTGSNTGMASIAFGMLVQNDLLYVASQNGRISVFPATASGDVAPLQTITGSATHVQAPIGMAIANNELYAADLANWIVSFPLDANGNVAPDRWIHGPDTHLNTPVYLAIVGQQLVCTQDEGNGVLGYPMESTEDQPPSSGFTGSASGERLGLVAY